MVPAARETFGWPRAIAADLVAWSLLPAGFLFVYIKGYAASAEAIWPHLQVALLPLLGLALVRLTLSRALGPFAARLAAALAASAVLAVMTAYYGLALTGLQYWGRVVSWDLIASYAAQASRLAETLEISWWLVLGAAGLAYAALLYATWAYLRRFDWAAALGPRLSLPALALIVLCGALFLATELYQFRAAPPTRASEPVSLTFYPAQAALNFQTHVVDQLSAARRDATEDMARAAYVPSPAAERRNVIVIVVDALRADHMGIYGYTRDTTPHLARLAKAGIVRKAAARAACSSSVCGLLSITSSKFVHQFSRRPITLPEVLRRHDYRIHMILSGNHTLFYGLKELYGPVDTYFDAHPVRPGQYMNDDRLVVEHLSGFPPWDGRPMMMQLHLMSVHTLGWRDPALAKYRPAANYALSGLAGDTAGPHTRAVNYYDNGVLQADAMINTILEMLQHKGYLRDAVVAITADHGEALGEHGLFSHANGVRDETLNIPFVLLSYGYRPAAPIGGAPMASQVDIAPTLLAELGMAAPATWKGMALQRPLAREFLYFQEQSELGILDLRDPGNVWKYWSNLRTGEEYAFNLSLDPQQRRNRIGEASAQHRREWRLQVLGNSSALN